MAATTRAISDGGRVRSMEHDGCKLCKYEHCSMESKECSGCTQNATDKYKRMTNADRIRSMSDEELADFLMDVSMGMLFDKKVMNVETWLQSEVEE